MKHALTLLVVSAFAVGGAMAARAAFIAAGQPDGNWLPSHIV